MGHPVYRHRYPPIIDTIHTFWYNHTKGARRMNTVWDTGTIEDIPLGITARCKVGGYIFRYRPGVGQERMDYYAPTNPRTAAQQAWRAVFADGIAAWHALSDAEKAEWNQRAKAQQKVGQHLFQSVYLKTHEPTYETAKVDFAIVGQARVG
jgi:hypothetical protein